MNFRIAGRVVAAAAVLLLTSAAWAEVTETDFLVAGRAIGFIDNLRPGPLRVGIVYAAGNAQSEQQARELASFMGAGKRIGNFTLKPVLLSVDSLNDGNIDLYFLTQGVGAEAAKVGSATRSRKIPCVTFDLAQVRTGACTMGVRTTPRIEVLVNRAAAEATGTKLAAVFRMMITEI